MKAFITVTFVVHLLTFLGVFLCSLHIYLKPNLWKKYGEKQEDGDAGREAGKDGGR